MGKNHGYYRTMRDSKYIYQHRIVAEKMLGRPLKEGEVVHHIDGNRLNNSENNLMIFETNSDHIAFHRGHKATLKEDRTYYCKDKDIMNICPICHNYKQSYSEMCINCYTKYKNPHKCNSIPTKEQLLDLILKNSFVSIGKMYGVSDNAVRKWCKKYKLPFRKKDIDIYKKIC